MLHYFSILVTCPIHSRGDYYTKIWITGIRNQNKWIHLTIQKYKWIGLPLSLETINLFFFYTIFSHFKNYINGIIWLFSLSIILWKLIQVIVHINSSFKKKLLNNIQWYVWLNIHFLKDKWTFFQVFGYHIWSCYELLCGHRLFMHDQKFSFICVEWLRVQLLSSIVHTCFVCMCVAVVFVLNLPSHFPESVHFTFHQQCISFFPTISNIWCCHYFLI